MNKFFSLALLASMILFISACDKVSAPSPENNIIQTPNNQIIWDDSAKSESNNGDRFVLLEEFTGHNCAFCPDGAKIAKEIASKYSPKVIVVAIHSGIFAEFDPNANMYFTDFNTELGDELRNFLHPISYPSAAINRVFDSNSRTYSRSKWEQKTLNFIDNSAIANISIQNKFDDSSQIVQSTIIIDWLSGFTSQQEYNLQLVVTESGIIDWQKDGSENIPDYQHNHVLRSGLNGFYGEKIVAPAIGSSLSDTLVHNFRLPENILNVHNCTIVAYLYNTGPDDFEVLQVNEAHITSN